MTQVSIFMCFITEAKQNFEKWDHILVKLQCWELRLALSNSKAYTHSFPCFYAKLFPDVVYTV